MLTRLAPGPSVFATVLCCAVGAAVPASGAAGAPRRSYDLPPATRPRPLKRFAADAGEQIVFMVDTVRGETTNAVAGHYAAREALDRMLAGTALFASQDRASGALVVGRTRPARPASPAGEPPYARLPPRLKPP